MSKLVVIGILLMVSVLVMDLIVRIVIVCNMRKQRRAVKPLPEPMADLRELRINGGNPNLHLEPNSIIEEEDDDDDVENQSIPSVWTWISNIQTAQTRRAKEMY